MTYYSLTQALLVVLLLQEASTEITTTVSNDLVFSGESATLTCTVSADNSETLLAKQWQDSNGDVITTGTAGDFEKNGIKYTITDLGLTDNQIVNWKIEMHSVVADNSLTCFALSNGGPPKTEKGRVEVVGITPVNTVSVTGERSSVSCLLTGASDAVSPAAEWSLNGTPIISGDSSYSMSTDYTGPDKVATLTEADVTSDHTFTCSFTAGGGGAVSSTVTIDHVTITPTGYSHNLTQNGTMATLSCLLSDANQAPSAAKWYRSDGSEITGSDEGFTIIPYEKSGGTISLVVTDPASLTESDSFTCCFEFAEGSCKEGVARLEVVKEEEEEEEEGGNGADGEGGEDGDDDKGEDEDGEDGEEGKGDEKDRDDDGVGKNGVESNKSLTAVVVLSMTTFLLMMREMLASFQ